VKTKNMLEPKISVVIPTHNRAFCVGEAIESCLKQASPETEVIVVDDGSTDETPKVLNRFGDRIRVIRQRNSGVSAARNAGIIAAYGDWILPLDSDDELIEGALEHFELILRTAPEIIAIGGDVLLKGIGQDRSLFSVRNFRVEQPFGLFTNPLRLVLTVQFFTSGTVVSRSAALAAGVFDTGMSLYEDGDFHARLALQGPWGVTPRLVALVVRKGMREEALSFQHRQDPTATPRARTKIFAKLLATDQLSAEDRPWVRLQYGHALLSWVEADLQTHGVLGTHLVRRAIRASHNPRLLAKAALFWLLGRQGVALMEKARRMRKRDEFRRSDV